MRVRASQRAAAIVKAQASVTNKVRGSASTNYDYGADADIDDIDDIDQGGNSASTASLSTTASVAPSTQTTPLGTGTIVTKRQPAAAAPRKPVPLSTGRVVFKLCHNALTSITAEVAARASLRQVDGRLIDGIVPILDFPLANMPFIVMPHCGGDLEHADLTDDSLRHAIVQAYAQFEATLLAIHRAGFVVFDLYPRNILVQRVPDGSVKLWLTDLESMLKVGAPCRGSPQKRVSGLAPETADPEDDWVRWELVKTFVDSKGLSSPFDFDI